VAPDLIQAIELLKKRALEYAYLQVLLYVLDIDIDVRRKLEEKFRYTEFLDRQSIRVERSREDEQFELERVEGEIESVVQLILKIARNEAAA
jgi:tRNA U34 5-carboxymethylaminomethyl modifying enzyme MnmG/GidA